ncbi:MAG: DMT family transporter [Actinomycetota bacterium]
MRSRLPVAEAALLSVAAVWGLTFVMVQDAVAVVPVMTFLAFRFIPASLLVGVIFRKELSGLGARGMRRAGLMGAFLTGGYIFQTLGLERTTVSNVGFITGLYVVLTPVFGALLLKHLAGPPVWIAAAMSAVGLFLLTGASGEVHLLGDALVFLCACSFAGHILVTDVAVRDHSTGALLTVQLGVCGSFTLIVAAVMGDLMIPRSGTVWSALIVTSLFASALGFFIQTWAQRNAPPARTALILASEAAFAALFGYLLVHEVLTPIAWVGAGLILLAIVVVELFPYLRRVRPLPEGTVATDPHMEPATSETAVRTNLS